MILMWRCPETTCFSVAVNRPIYIRYMNCLTEQDFPSKESLYFLSLGFPSLLDVLHQTLWEVKPISCKVEHLLGNQFWLCQVDYPAQILHRARRVWLCWCQMSQDWVLHNQSSRYWWILEPLASAMSFTSLQPLWTPEELSLGQRKGLWTGRYDYLDETSDISSILIGLLGSKNKYCWSPRNWTTLIAEGRVLLSLRFPCWM